MICSDLLNNIKITRTTKKAVYVFLSALLLSLFVFCASSPSVRAEKETTAPSIDSVNLREAQWVYSVYTDKSNVRYAAVTRYDGGETESEQRVLPFFADKRGGRGVFRVPFHHGDGFFRGADKDRQLCFL